MKQIQIQLLDYSELSEDAKSKALENYNQNNSFDFLSEDLNEYLSQLLEDNGIKGDAKLYYDLSYCQGDGVSFEGNFEYKDVNFSIGNEGRDIEADYSDEDELKNDLIELLESEFIEKYKEICEAVKKNGYSEIEYQESEEAFKDTCEANEYTFEANGEMRNF